MPLAFTTLAASNPRTDAEQTLADDTGNLADDGLAEDATVTPKFYKFQDPT